MHEGRVLIMQTDTIVDSKTFKQFGIDESNEILIENLIPYLVKNNLNRHASAMTYMMMEHVLSTRDNK